MTVPIVLSSIGLVAIVLSFIPSMSIDARGEQQKLINYGLKASGVIFLLVSLYVLMTL